MVLLPSSKQVFCWTILGSILGFKKTLLKGAFHWKIRGVVRTFGMVLIPLSVLGFELSSEAFWVWRKPFWRVALNGTKGVLWKSVAWFSLWQAFWVEKTPSEGWVSLDKKSRRLPWTIRGTVTWFWIRQWSQNHKKSMESLRWGDIYNVKYLQYGSKAPWEWVGWFWFWPPFWVWKKTLWRVGFLGWEGVLWEPVA